MELSLTELLARADQEIGKAQEAMERGEQGAEGRLAQAEARHAELLARRERRRKELQQERSLTLQAVERLTSVLVLPHPERESPEVRQLRPNLQTEAIAMQVAIEYEKSQGREFYDVHEKNLGYDLTSLDLRSGELRLIEVKGLGEAEGSVMLTPNRCSCPSFARSPNAASICSHGSHRFAAAPRHFSSQPKCGKQLPNYL